MQPQWQIAFTKTFKNEVAKIPRKTKQQLDAKLSLLRKDPYDRCLGIVRVKRMVGRYRVRLGDYRLIYHINQNNRQIILTNLGPRSTVYDEITKQIEPVGLLQPPDAKARKTASPAGRDDSKLASHSPHKALLYESVPHDTSAPGADQELCVEPTPLEKDDLALLRIPEQFWNSILAAEDWDALQRLDLPSPIKALIEDYVTNPSQTHVGRLYSLDPEDSISSIASRPLDDFLLALDPQQREAAERPIDTGPLLIQGGPGTGKSLIALYRMRHLLNTRAVESLFDTEKPFFRFLSYTNTLVNTSKSMFQSIAHGGPPHFRVKFSTFDKMVNRGLEYFGVSLKGVLSENELEAFLTHDVLQPLRHGTRHERNAAAYIEDRLGVSFLSEEITELIEANGIETRDAYLAFQRRGRKTALQRSGRDAVWTAYLRFREQCEAQHWYTWAGKRFQFFKLLQKNAERFPNAGYLADYLVVDEAQDMSVVSLRTLPLLVRDPRNIMLLADSGQSIYNRAPSWKNISKSLRFHRGNSIILSRSYRLTKELAQALHPLRNDTGPDPDDPTLDIQGVFTGGKPTWMTLPRELHGDAVADIAHRLIAKEKVNGGQIAIILRRIHPKEEIQDTFIRPLQERGFNTYLFRKDASLNIHGDSIHVITAHSAKGLEFPFVIVPEVSDRIYPLRKDEAEPPAHENHQEWIENEQRLLYVALSRASYGLWMIVDEEEPSRFLQRLRPEDWDIE